MEHGSPGVDAMSAALSETQDQPGVTFRALEAVAQAVLGVRLFTIMELDRERGFARRSYSNMSHAYPVSGEKPIEPNDWLRQIEQQQMAATPHESYEQPENALRATSRPGLAIAN